MIIIRKRFAIPTVLVMSITFAFLITAGSAMAADVNTSWSNIDQVKVNVSNDYSYGYLSGSAGDLDGAFNANVSDRVDVERATARFAGTGSYTFQTYNNHYGGEGWTTMTTEGKSGYVNAKTNLWDSGMRTKSYRHGDPTILGATGDHNMSVSAFKDANNDGTMDDYCGTGFGVSTGASGGSGITKADPYYESIVEVGDGSISTNGIIEGGDSGFSYSFDFER